MRLDAPTLDLLRQRLRAGNPLWLPLTTASMAPTLRPGDRVLVQFVALRDLAPGDILLCGHGGLLLAHRLMALRRAEPRLLTKGDALRAFDPPLPSGALLGRVVTVERDGRKIELHSATPLFPPLTRARLRWLVSYATGASHRLYRGLRRLLPAALTLLLLALPARSTGATTAVTISSFTATGGNGQIVLQWSTASEDNNYGFDIERSQTPADPDSWDWIDTVDSQSPCLQNLTTLNYEYADTGLGEGQTYYYRLWFIGWMCDD
ncbi:MAG: S26 family signal peptidase, partial [Chloroflexi bacterium]|nr:S26 family signal peptidase [Chloroflexota bacterium]